MIISMVHFCCTLLSKIILEGSCTIQKVVVDTHLKHKIRVAFLPKTFFCQPPTYPFSYFCYLSRFFLSFWEIFWKLDWGISRIYCCMKIRKKSRVLVKKSNIFSLIQSRVHPKFYKLSVRYSNQEIQCSVVSLASLTQNETFLWIFTHCDFPFLPMLV